MLSTVAAEEAVIGCVLLKNELIHSLPINSSDFSVASFRRIYESMEKLGNAGRPIDVTILAVEGHDQATIIQCMENIPSIGNCFHYAGIVKEGSQRRQINDISEYLKTLANSSRPVSECVLEAESRILSIRGKETEGRIRRIDELSDELVDLVEKRKEMGSGFFGHKTGFTSLDKMLGGLQDGETAVLAGRPSMGKSSVATQIIINRARQGAHCLFFSLEMSHHMCGMRMMSQLSGVPMSKIRSGQINEEEMQILQNSKKELHTLKIWIDDTGAITVPQIRVAAKQILAQSGKLSLVVVDYLQLCGTTGREGRERDVAEASAGLKALAKEMNMPVIVLSQLNRSCEARDDKRPRLSDLRESGAIEQDADSVIMVYRHGAYYEEADQSEIELIIRKNRNGPLGTATVSWNPESMAVQD